MMPLDSLSNLELHSVQAELVSYRNRPALRLIEPDMESEAQRIAILPGLTFKNGIIETELVGGLRADAPLDMRGFVGIAFRVQPQGSAEEHPGVYESYADLVPGEWTKVKIVVSGVRAQLYVNGAEQPCLMVNDLKLGEIEGGIALWIGTGTEAYFSEVLVKPLEGG